MQYLAPYHSLFASLWVLWFFLLFGGILLWTLRPSRRRAMAEHAEIPFREQDQ